MSERKKQHIGIKIVDHRTEDDAPNVTYEQFDNHKDYLSRMRELGRPPEGCRIHELTWSKVTIAPRGEQQTIDL